jgi:hypothetical protein
MAVVEAGGIPLLLVCMQEPELPLKRICASALGDVAKHSPELAQTVVTAGAVPAMTKLLVHVDSKLKRHVCSALSRIGKHNVDLAEVVVEGGLFPASLGCLQDADLFVRKNASMAIRDVVKHSEELAAISTKAGALGGLVEYGNEAEGNARLPALMGLGYIAAASESLALAVADAGGVDTLKAALVAEPLDHVKSASAWGLGQVGRHSTEHANLLLRADACRHLLAVMLHEDSSEDLASKSKRALKAILGKGTVLPPMQALLPASPPSLARIILSRFAAVLPEDGAARREVVGSGGLKLIQQIPMEDEETVELVAAVNANFPPEVVEYCKPDYKDVLAEKVATQVAHS